MQESLAASQSQCYLPQSTGPSVGTSMHHRPSRGHRLAPANHFLPFSLSSILSFSHSCSLRPFLSPPPSVSVILNPSLSLSTSLFCALSGSLTLPIYSSMRLTHTHLHSLSLICTSNTNLCSELSVQPPPPPCPISTHNKFQNRQWLEESWWTTD